MRECVSSVPVVVGAVGECGRSSFISPVVLGLGFISEAADPYKATLFWPADVRMSASDLELTVKDKRCFFSCVS